MLCVYSVVLVFKLKGRHSLCSTAKGSWFQQPPPLPRSSRSQTQIWAGKRNGELQHVCVCKTPLTTKHNSYRPEYKIMVAMKCCKLICRLAIWFCLISPCPSEYRQNLLKFGYQDIRKGHSKFTMSLSVTDKDHLSNHYAHDCQLQANTEQLKFINFIVWTLHYTEKRENQSKQTINSGCVLYYIDSFNWFMP